MESQSSKIFTKEENYKEFLGSGWRDIGPLLIDYEIKHAMIRNEVENYFYNFKFLVKINEQYKLRFNDYNFHKERIYDENKERIYLERFYEAILFG